MMLNSKDLVDPELKDFLAAMPNEELTRASLPKIRAAMQATIANSEPAADSRIQIGHHSIPGPVNSPPVRILSYRRAGVSGVLPGLLHLHGGGYVLGRPEMTDTANRRLALELGCVIFSVDYRLAPETPFPGPIEDCYAALEWVSANAGSLGVDHARIGVKGESAGGGLAAALSVLTRDRSGPRLAFQHLIYPMLDDRTCTDVEPNPFAGQFVWTAAQNTFGWSALLGKPPGSACVPAGAAAARTASLGDLPPAFIGVGSLDLFLDENLAYARRLCVAGVPVELHVYPGAFHRFYEARNARVAQTAERDSTDALRRCMYE